MDSTTRRCEYCGSDLTRLGSLAIEARVRFRGSVLPGDVPEEDDWDEYGYEVLEIESIQCVVCGNTGIDVRELTVEATHNGQE